MSPGVIDAAGRERIHQLVLASLGWQGLKGSYLYGSGRISRATFDRIKRGEVVSDTMLRAVGDALGLPRDFLLYVGAGDIAKIREAGGDPDLIRWTLALVAADKKPRGKTPRATAS